MISGCVSSKGERLRGEGFRAEQVNGRVGVIDVEFDDRWLFVEPPSVVATQVYPEDPESAILPNTLSNVIVVGVSTHGFRLVTGAPNGLPVARAFNFIAAGLFGTPADQRLTEAGEEAERA